METRARAPMLARLPFCLQPPISSFFAGTLPGARWGWAPAALAGRGRGLEDSNSRAGLGGLGVQFDLNPNWIARCQCHARWRSHPYLHARIHTVSQTLYPLHLNPRARARSHNPRCCNNACIYIFHAPVHVPVCRAVVLPRTRVAAVV